MFFCGIESIRDRPPSPARWLFGLALALAAPARADWIYDAYPNPQAPYNTYGSIFPNWVDVPTSSFIVPVCDDTACAWCLSSSIVGLTIFNYATASGSAPGGGGDIQGVSFEFVCSGAIATGLVPMTFAGDWTYGAQTYPAWTWSGDLPFAKDPCGQCACNIDLFLYTDVGPCPTDGATVELGIGFDPNTFCGGLADNCGVACSPPYWQVMDGARKEIRYITKTGDKEAVAPGETINYTVTFGVPGTSALSNIVIMDTQPPDTHLVSGSAVPAPDPGFPDPGPPPKLRWTLPGGSPTGGATRQVSFSLRVDWGNTEVFEPGSGDATPPEGSRLRNRAEVFWNGSDCVPSLVSPQTNTVVTRFLFWKIGNNDLLRAGRLGQPDDEMIYEIFVKNVSTTKTWWNVEIWDTVPAGLDVWSPNMGFEDPCLGWTITPSGCAAANPSPVFSGTDTILRWSLDLPPGETIVLKWKARLKPTVAADSTVINQVAIQAMGRTGIVGGTGDSREPAIFTHLATVKLRTTYYSYTSYAGSNDQRGCTGFFISFWPLNVNTFFELRKLEYQGGAGVSGAAGTSATINALVGTCAAGFADGGLSTAGCGPERSPAMYWPGIWNNICPAYPFNFLYKVTSNTPYLWMIMSEACCGPVDSFTYIPSTSLSYRGFIHYTTVRPQQDGLANAGAGDRLAIINTGMNAADVFDPTLDTTVHIFVWDVPSKSWQYLKTGFVDGESIWMPFESTNAAFPEEVFHYRIISSDAQNLIYQGFATWGAPSIGGAFDNHGSYAPNRENGNLVSPTDGAGNPLPANFYPLVHPSNRQPNCVIGNTGSVQATYRLWKYIPYNMTVPNGNWPTTLAGNSGYWQLKATHTVDPGLAGGVNPGPGNAHIYGSNTGDTTLNNTINYVTGWKVELVSGGPIQVLTGGGIFFCWSGASNIHDATGKASGDEFWFHRTRGDCGFGGSCNGFSRSFLVNVFCPKTGTAVTRNDTAGGSVTYTTDGVDQAITFMPFPNVAAYSDRDNYQMIVTAGSGPLVAQYHQCMYDEKFLTAPFVETGVHYDIIAPPVVYVGQDFWLTIVVVDSGGGTKTDYVGTSAFTSTDPGAAIGGTGMGTYTYPWVAGDQGVKVFVNVTMTRLGLQAIVASDIVDGSIIGVGSVMVVGADVKLFKEPRFGTAASGDTVTFRICWSNYSSATAFEFTITDAVPEGTNYVPDPASAMVCGTSAPAPAVDVAYATTASASVPPASDFSPVGGGAPGITRWLRWTVRDVYVRSTGCVCFRARVD